MQISVYLYHNLVPRNQVKLFRCQSCNRPMFKYSADNLLITNGGITSMAQYEPSSHVIELQCHSCNTKHQILFQ